VRGRDPSSRFLLQIGEWRTEGRSSCLWKTCVDLRSRDIDGRGDVEAWAYLRLARGTCTDRWE